MQPLQLGRRVRRRLLRLDHHESAMLFMLMMVLMSLIWVIWIAIALQIPVFAHYIDVQVYQQMLGVYALCYAVALVIVWHSLRYRSQRDGARLLFLCILLFEAALLYSNYLTGLLLTQAGIIATGIPLITMLFAPVRLIIQTTLISVIAVTTLAVLNGTGQLPYAPLYPDAHNIGYDVGFTLFYLCSHLIVTLPILALIIVTIMLVFREWRQREQEILSLSQRDSLTNLYNRRVINEYLSEVMRQPAGLMVSVILLDLDYFKRINDSYGHLTGDRALQMVSGLLQQEVRPGDIVGRFGGEEFIIVLNGVSLPIALQVAERCRHRLQRADFYSDNQETVHVTASFGITTFETGQDFTINDVLRSADSALYRAKRLGRNRVEYHPCGRDDRTPQPQSRI